MSTNRHHSTTRMKSLFILSLPRSLSTQVHSLCCDGLGLQTPAWTSAGEILNIDRSLLLNDKMTSGVKFIRPQHVTMFGPAKEYLSHVFEPKGYCYKDVVQPFVVADWLRNRSEINVLKIVPNITHVAFAMIARNWLYPTTAAVRNDGVLERMLSGLMQAAKAIESVPGEAVSYDELIFDLDPLRRALSRLYPGVRIQAMDLGSEFDSDRARLLQRRTLDEYVTLQRLEQEVRASGAATDVAHSTRAA